MKLQMRVAMLAWVALWVSLAPVPAVAYVGPGSGLSAIGAFLALLAGIVVALFGFIWYPVKRLLRKRKAVEDEAAGGDG